MDTQDFLSLLNAEIRLGENYFVDSSQIQCGKSSKDRITLLNLSMTGIARVPITIKKLTELHSLFLMNNRLTYIPETICDLSQLRYLNAFNNRIREMPENIGNLTKLIHLDLGCNNIHSLPQSMGNLVNLQRLNIENNSLKELPRSFTNLSSLRVVYLYGNPINTMHTKTREILDYMKYHYGTIFYIDKYMNAESIDCIY